MNKQKIIKWLASHPRTPKTIYVDEKVGRNQPCPCGSEMKFKHCCLKVDKDFQSEIYAQELAKDLTYSKKR